MGINKVILVGNVGRDPEMRSTTSGTSVVNFTVATNEQPRSKEQSEPHTEWHNIVAFGRLAEVCSQYLSKGRQVYIEGKIRTRTYEKDGQKKWFTEIWADTVQFLGSGRGGEGGGGPREGYEPQGGGFPDDQDDVPF